MGPVAQAVVGKIIVSVLVSKVATKAAESLGIDPKVSTILGAAAGIYAQSGIPMPGDAPQAAKIAEQSKATATPLASAPAPDAPIQTLTDPAAGPRVPATNADVVNASNVTPGVTQTVDPGQRMTRAVNYAPKGVSTTAPIDNLTPSSVDDFESARGTGILNYNKTPSDPPGMFERIWNSERTGDVIAGGTSGLFTGYMTGLALEDKLKAEEASKAATRDRWRAYDPRRMPQMNFPNFKPRRMLSR